MSICCVDGCTVDDKDDVTYFPFPVKPTLLRKWREAINSTQKLHADSRVCSRHFSAGDISRVRGKLRLKGRVVPTIFHNKQQSAPPSPHNPPDTNGSTTQTQDGRADTQDGDSASNKDGGDAAVSEDLQMTDESPRADSEPDDGAPCTIECVPEAILTHDSDSPSSPEPELHKEDIEDIIANYHIKQDRAIAERLRAASAGGTETAGVREKGASETDGARTGACERAGAREGECDVIEVEGLDRDEPPEFIEISVDSGKTTGDSQRDDCLMVLEKVQVDIDPSSLMMMRPDDDDDDKSRCDDPISLLTSSDSDDVILEEPQIDCVSLSSETDEDDRPLVRLVRKKEKRTDFSKLVWGNLTEYYCYLCKFRSYSRAESDRHKLTHSKILIVCETCNLTCSSKSQLSRHKKKHKEEKRFKCPQCDYKARHSMSLVYHMKSHDSATDTIDITHEIEKKKNQYKCKDCKFHTSSRRDMLRHARSCEAGLRALTHECDQCSYSTKRKNDLKRHKLRKHAGDDDVIED